MEKNKKSKAMDVKCPHGLIKGRDFNQFLDVCDICMQTSKNDFRECRKINQTCSRKASYDDFTLANFIAQKNNISSYKCPYCNSFHNGNNGV